MFNYFCHPSCLSMMEDVLKMRMSEGSAGFGLYVMLLEQLRNSDSYSIKFEPAVLAWSLHEPNVELLTRVVQDYGLFNITEDGIMSSPWLCSAMAEHDAKRAKLSAAGKKSAAMRQQSSNQVATTLPAAPQPPCNEVDKKEQQINKRKEINKQKNTTPTTSGEGEEVDIFSEEFISKTGKEKGELFDPAVHARGVQSNEHYNPNILIAAAVTYRLTVHQTAVLDIAMDNCRVGSPRLVEFIRVLKHCKDTNFKPTFPFEYFMSQLKRVAV